MIKISSVEFLGLLYRIIPGKIKNAVYHLGISALVLEIFKFEKFVKYANEITGDARWGRGGGGGGYFGNFLLGMCRWDPGTLSLYQS